MAINYVSAIIFVIALYVIYVFYLNAAQVF